MFTVDVKQQCNNNNKAIIHGHYGNKNILSKHVLVILSMGIIAKHVDVRHLCVSILIDSNNKTCSCQAYTCPIIHGHLVIKHVLARHVTVLVQLFMGITVTKNSFQACTCSWAL